MASGIRIDRITDREANDLVQLVHLFSSVFGQEPSPLPTIEYYERILSDPNFIVVVAKLDDVVIGVLTAYVLHGYHSSRPIAYAYDLAVHPDHQRKGIGRSIMEFTIEHCRYNDFEELFIQAELDDDDAIAFYRSMPFSQGTNASSFSYKLSRMLIP